MLCRAETLTFADTSHLDYWLAHRIASKNSAHTTRKRRVVWVPFCTFFGGKRQASSTKTFICVAILFILFSRLLVRNAFGHRRECSLNCQLLEFIVSGAPVQLNIPRGSLLLLITQPARYRIFDWHFYDNTTVVYGTG